MWIRDYGISGQITNHDTEMYYFTNIDKSAQGSSGNMNATKKGKHHAKVRQINWRKILQSLWPVKYCERASAQTLAR